MLVCFYLVATSLQPDCLKEMLSSIDSTNGKRHNTPILSSASFSPLSRNNKRLHSAKKYREIPNECSLLTVLTLLWCRDFLPKRLFLKVHWRPKVMRRHICLRVLIKKRFFHFVITFSYQLIEKDAAPYDQLKY